MDTSTAPETSWPSAHLASSGPVAVPAVATERLGGTLPGSPLPAKPAEPPPLAATKTASHRLPERLPDDLAGDLPGGSAADLPVDLWAAALAALASKVSAHNFELWFRPIRCVRIDERSIQLQAPNSFIQEWFGNHYLRIVLDEVRRVAALHHNHDHDFNVEWLLPETGVGDGSVVTAGRGQTSVQAMRQAARAKKRPAAEAGDPTRSTPQAAASDHQRSPTGSPARGSAATAGSIVPGPPPAGVATGLSEKYSFGSFIVGPSNQLAEAASRAVAENPAGKYNPLFIYGGVGLGKTHLLHAIGAQIRGQHPSWRIVYLKAETFLNEYVQQVRNGRIDEFRSKYRDQVDVLLVDDIQYLGGKERTQDEFFHTFNALFESHRQIVITADKYPHEIPDLEERIRSRFQWGLIADIQPPELETRIAILEKKAQLEGVDLPSDVAHFLAANIKSNVRELEGLLIRVAAMASLRQQPITVDFAQETLKNFLGQVSPHLSIDGVQKEVANYFGISIADLCGSSRQAKLARARQIAMYLARKLCKSSYPELGERFGGKDHTTVMSACRRIDALLPVDPKVRASVEEIEKHLTV